LAHPNRDGITMPDDRIQGDEKAIGATSPASSRGASARPRDVQANAAERAAAAELLRMIWGIHISRAVYAVAHLGIADLLAERPTSASELAVATDTHEPSLYRVLRCLAALGVFEEHEGRSFSLTVIGDRLRSDAEIGMRSWATLIDAHGGVRPFEHVLETVKTGNPGFDTAFGTGTFEFLAEHPAETAIHDAAMSERTAAFASSVAEGHNFSDARTVVDVGGGRGTLLVEILRTHPHLHGAATAHHQQRQHRNENDAARSPTTPSATRPAQLRRARALPRPPQCARDREPSRDRHPWHPRAPRPRFPAIPLARARRCRRQPEPAAPDPVGGAHRLDPRLVAAAFGMTPEGALHYLIGAVETEAAAFANV
jgi:O-methyltransferase domain